MKFAYDFLGLSQPKFGDATSKSACYVLDTKYKFTKYKFSNKFGEENSRSYCTFCRFLEYPNFNDGILVKPRKVSSKHLVTGRKIIDTVSNQIRRLVERKNVCYWFVSCNRFHASLHIISFFSCFFVFFFQFVFVECNQEVDENKTKYIRIWNGINWRPWKIKRKYQNKQHFGLNFIHSYICCIRLVDFVIFTVFKFHTIFFWRIRLYNLL